MRRWRRGGVGALAASALGWGCAHVEAPPGGPEDRTPPALVAIAPDSNVALSTFGDPVTFVFDERISESSIEDAVSVSPRTSPVEVRHGRQEIRVSLRNGWEPGIVYHVRVGTEVRDLFNNPLAGPITLVFSTGPEIPATVLQGRVTDRITGEREQGVRVEAIRSDSLVYAVASDSAGRFELSRVPEGEYLVRGFRDMNRNRALDPFEPRDSTRAAVGITAPVEVALRLLPVDTTAPVPGPVTLRDGVVEIEFDDPLDPEQAFGPGAVTVSSPAGGPVPIDGVFVGEVSAAPADSVPAGDPPAADPTEALPSRTLLIVLEAGVELEAGATYRIVVSGVRNVNGLTGGGEVELSAPAAPPEP